VPVLVKIDFRWFWTVCGERNMRSLNRVGAPLHQQDIRSPSRSERAIGVDEADATHRLLDRGHQALLLACDGDKIVGSIIGGSDGGHFQLYKLAVD
jgi:hypothetical protein